MRIINVGMSETEICGVRSYAEVLADELTELGHQAENLWFERAAIGNPADVVRQARAWAKGLVNEVAARKPDVVVWHYSVFTYGLKGVPVLVPAFTRALRETGVPVVGLLHEYAYPWEWDRGRGLVWAVSQRAVLPTVLRTLHGAVVTTDGRARSLARSRLFRAKPVTMSPVYSLLPDARAARQSTDAVGVIAWRDDGMADIVVDALAALRVERPNLQLIVLGAPGPDSDLGRRWSASAQRAGQRIDFSGILSDPVEFAALAANASVMVFADRVGPSSRKTTLASALASGTPTIAFDGPDTWRALRTERAVELVGADPIPLAETIGRLLDDEEARAALGARGHDFYAGHQSAAVTVPHLVEFLQTVTG